MTRRVQILVSLLAVFLAAACSRPGVAPGGDHIKFSHGRHLREGLTCGMCHTATAAAPDGGTVPGATQWSGRLSEQRCRACHSVEHRPGHPEEQLCGYCHTQPQAPRGYARVQRELHFDHAAHLPRVRGNCSMQTRASNWDSDPCACRTCHSAGVDTSSFEAFNPTIPNMDGCATRCHSADLGALNCTRCHASLRRFAMDEISSPRHGPGYARHHGAEARSMSNACSQCHEVTFCSRCHSAAPGMPVADLDPMAVTHDFVHRGDFFARHSDEARFQTNSCTRCHGVEFCDGCHRTSGVGGGVGPGNTHPP
ncbi:MAG: cytochrome c3 family protein, partial [Deltaproteobacteria bacterium]